MNHGKYINKDRHRHRRVSIREIVFRLLAGGQGARLSHLLASGGDTRRISKAIGYLRENIYQPLRMDDIAHELGMSISGFHHHFKSVTAMSPLQFRNTYDFRKRAV